MSDRPPGTRDGRAQRPGRTSILAGSAADFGFPETVECAFCGSSSTSLHSPFGSALSVATYWCSACNTAFEWIKWG